MYNNVFSMNELDTIRYERNMDFQSDDSNQINISDVIEVIETDEAFGFPQPRRYSSDRGMAGARLKIIEQPAPKGLRFRYECEGRSAGSLPGISSTPENKTYPTVQIVGYTGKAVIIVSCVTKDPPYKPHPHNLVGRETCKNGVCRVKLLGDTMTATFANLGIQCVKKKDIEEALKVREKLRMDPFGTGFSHKNQTSSIDLNSVRLCFQAFLEGNEKERFTVPLEPVVSEPIYDKKAIADLIICKISHGAASVAGGQEIIILCEKVAKEDISIRFFEEGRDGVTWEGYADFIPGDVHKQVAISLRTPRYRTLEIEQPVKVYIQLRRPSDGKTSSPHPFLFTPLDSGRPLFWSLRRNKGKYLSLSEILQRDIKESSEIANDTNNNCSVVNNDDNRNEGTMITESEEMPVKVEVKPDPMKNVIVLPDTSADEMDSDVNGNFEDLLDHVKSLESMYPENNNESELGVYSSLQMAMKNPCEILDTQSVESYEDIAPPRPLKMLPKEPEEEAAPPLPPKRAKKAPALPPLPSHGKSKLNIFQKLFTSTGKRKKKQQREPSREGSVVSRISERSVSLAPSNEIKPNDVDLTEAEHYALYTSFAPHATASEFDEMSFYYSPIERQKVN